jgi:hypothetical protein
MSCWTCLHVQLQDTAPCHIDGYVMGRGLSWELGLGYSQLLHSVAGGHCQVTEPLPVMSGFCLCFQGVWTPEQFSQPWGR